MKILVTGAAGFLGSAAVERALAAGHEPIAMVRRPFAAPPPGRENVRMVLADLENPETFPAALEGAGAVIHCAAATSEGRPDWERSRRVNVEGTAALAKAAEAAGRRVRWIQISSMSAHPGSTSVYGRSKLQADAELKKTGLDWTILRPSIIYGPGERGLAAKTVGLMRKLPVIPVVGAGRERLRPVLAEDVAEAALRCLALPATIGQTYMLGGADEVEFNEFLRKLGKAHGLRRRLIHLPIGPMLLATRAAERVLKKPPLTSDNVLGVKQAQRVDIEPFIRDTGFTPRGFDEGLRMIAPFGVSP